MSGAHAAGNGIDVRDLPSVSPDGARPVVFTNSCRALAIERTGAALVAVWVAGLVLAGAVRGSRTLDAASIGQTDRLGSAAGDAAVRRRGAGDALPGEAVGRGPAALVIAAAAECVQVAAAIGRAGAPALVLDAPQLRSKGTALAVQVATSWPELGEAAVRERCKDEDGGELPHEGTLTRQRGFR